MTIINRIFGWKDPILDDLPKEPGIIIFAHASYWDIFLIMIYIQCNGLKNMYCLVRPDLVKWYFAPLRWILKMIYAPSIHNKNSNSLSQIIEQFKNADSTPDNPKFLLLSPKGTVKKKEWRSGYYYIAQTLNLKIYPGLYDLTNRKIKFGLPVDPNKCNFEEATRNLQEQMGKYRVINMENAEYEINDPNGCPYESVLPFDFCCVSLLSFIPFLVGCYNRGYYFQLAYTLLTLCVAWRYHLDKEGTIYPKYVNIYQNIESGMAATGILYHFFSNFYEYGYIPTNFFAVYVFAIFFYLNSAPRGCGTHRGKYAIFHSFYHILAAISGYLLLCY